eukprot:COSAG01_NODE_12093_length_1802_cov_5.812096_1_plen_112_part_10
MIPASIIEDMQPTAVENYPVSDPVVQKQMPAEIQQHFDKGFVKTWSDIRQEFGVTEERPKNILPLNAIAPTRRTVNSAYPPRQRWRSSTSSTSTLIFPSHHPLHVSHITAMP